MNLPHFFSRVEERRAWAGALFFAALGLLMILGWLIWPGAFFQAYWFALMFWTQLSVGALILLLLQHVTGGAWGRAGAPLLRAAASGIFLLAPLFLPALCALPHIFSWTKIEPGISAQVLVNKQAWLNQPAFGVRTVFYLLAFCGLTAAWCRPRHPDIKWSGPMLAFCIVLISLGSADWMMSLQPTFYSSLYPFLYFSGAMVNTLALLAGTTAWLQKSGRKSAQPELLLADGKLLFASVLFWGYIIFCQFIIIWTGNLPDEAEWYVIRSTTGTLPLTLFVLAFHFVVPFCVLLSQSVKKNATQLFYISGALMVVHGFELFWIIRPTPGQGLRVSPFDFILPLVIGVGWLWFVLSPERLAALLDDKETHE